MDDSFSLFDHGDQQGNKTGKEQPHPFSPLAELIRPQSLEDMLGQEDLVSDRGIIFEMVQSKSLTSMILWGPPGTGKTTLARILAGVLNCDFMELSAVSSGLKEVREVLEKAKFNVRHRQKQTILFIDEIHRFNKAQQDSLLHEVEEGNIILIGATTENPSFEVNSALLSRCHVYQLHALDNTQLKKLYENIFALSPYSELRIYFDDQLLDYIVTLAGGDARKLIRTMELALSIAAKKEKPIAKEDIEKISGKKTILYDKKADYHYDVISAFIKSIRGSDPDAALYYLAVMLEGGEDILFIARRLVILASEDIGNADPRALILSTSAFQACHTIGMPEASLILGQATTYLASAPKSNASCTGISKAISYVKKYGSASVPLHIRNATTKLMKESHYGEGYKYPHDYDQHFIHENYLPEGIPGDTQFYKPTSIGFEQRIKERLTYLWKGMKTFEE